MADRESPEHAALTAARANCSPVLDQLRGSGRHRDPPQETEEAGTRDQTPAAGPMPVTWMEAGCRTRDWQRWLEVGDAIDWAFEGRAGSGTINSVELPLRADGVMRLVMREVPTP